MLTLAIEVSNPSAWSPGQPVLQGVAIGDVPERGEVLLRGFEPIDPAQTHHDDLIAAIDRLTRRLSLKPEQIKRIAVSSGPGGFTAVRLSVTTAAMIAEATGAACVPVPSAWVAARRCAATGRFAVALASKGETAHVTVFEANDRATGPGAIHDAGALEGLGIEMLVADRFLPVSMKARAGELGIVVEEPVFDAAACLGASRGIEPVDAAGLWPIYPREPEAVRKWRELKARRG